jgi:hypothetical protein
MLCFAWRRGASIAVLGGALAVGAAGAACGALGEANMGASGDAGFFPDAAGGDAHLPGDAGSVDGFGGDGPAIPPTTALFLQGSPSLPDVRLCWGIDGAIGTAAPFPGAGAMPASNYPGIPLGGAASMGDATALASTTPGTVTLYALDAENLARLDQSQTPQYTCDQLVCGQGSNLKPPCLRYNLDYWPVAMPTPGVQLFQSNVVALGGCLPAALDPAATAARCGASWTAVSGNLHAQVLQLAPAAKPAAGQLAVQAAMLSPGLAALVADAGNAVVSFGAADASAPGIIATLTSEGDLQPAAPQTVSVGTSLAAFGSTGFSVDVPGLDGGAGHVWMSLAEAQQLVDPTQDPTQFFGQATTYVVAVLGDPAAPHAFAGGGPYDGKGLHLLVVTSPAPSPASAGGEP